MSRVTHIPVDPIRERLRRLEPLVKRFIIEAPQFPGNIELAQQIGSVMGELCALAGVEARES